MENEHHAYYVTEDNCVLFYSEKYPNRNFASVESITEISEIPFDFTNINSKLHILLPITFPRDISEKPFVAELILTKSSGKLVPIDTIVNPITISGI